MPYIKQENRNVVDQNIALLAKNIVSLTKDEDSGACTDLLSVAGILNYTIVKLTLDVTKLLEEEMGTSLKRYFYIALMTGVFTNVKDEFYRRFAAPYEDKMIDTNGDVFEESNVGHRVRDLVKAATEQALKAANMKPGKE